MLEPELPALPGATPLEPLDPLDWAPGSMPGPRSSDPHASSTHTVPTTEAAVRLEVMVFDIRHRYLAGAAIFFVTIERDFSQRVEVVVFNRHSASTRGASVLWGCLDRNARARRSPSGSRS